MGAKMNATSISKDIATKWITALESGEYRQGYGSLHRDVEGASEFCCLGVLCELAAEAGIVEPAPLDPNHALEFCVGYSEVDDPTRSADYGLLPTAVVRWAKITHDSVSEGDEVLRDVYIRGEPLSALNDSRVPFKKIAKILRKHFNLPKET
jgi:hypothetical protein